jgi:hypothetical protein
LSPVFKAQGRQRALPPEVIAVYSVAGEGDEQFDAPLLVLLQSNSLILRHFRGKATNLLDDSPPAEDGRAGAVEVP